MLDYNIVHGLYSVHVRGQSHIEVASRLWQGHCVGGFVGVDERGCRGARGAGTLCGGESFQCCSNNQRSIIEWSRPNGVRTGQRPACPARVFQ